MKFESQITKFSGKRKIIEVPAEIRNKCRLSAKVKVEVEE